MRKAPEPTGDLKVDNERWLKWRIYHCQLWRFDDPPKEEPKPLEPWQPPISRHSSKPRRGELVLIVYRDFSTEQGIITHINYEDEEVRIHLQKSDIVNDYNWDVLDSNSNARVPWRLDL